MMSHVLFFASSRYVKKADNRLTVVFPFLSGPSWAFGAKNESHCPYIIIDTKITLFPHEYKKVARHRSDEPLCLPSSYASLICLTILPANDDSQFLLVLKYPENSLYEELFYLLRNEIVLYDYG